MSRVNNVSLYCCRSAAAEPAAAAHPRPAGRRAGAWHTATARLRQQVSHQRIVLVVQVLVERQRAGQIVPADGSSSFLPTEILSGTRHKAKNNINLSSKSS